MCITDRALPGFARGAQRPSRQADGQAALQPGEGRPRLWQVLARIRVDQPLRIDTHAAHVPVSYTHLDVYKRQGRRCRA